MPRRATERSMTCCSYPTNKSCLSRRSTDLQMYGGLLPHARHTVIGNWRMEERELSPARRALVLDLSLSVKPMATSCPPLLRNCLSRPWTMAASPSASPQPPLGATQSNGTFRLGRRSCGEMMSTTSNFPCVLSAWGPQTRPTLSTSTEPAWCFLDIAHYARFCSGCAPALANIIAMSPWRALATVRQSLVAPKLEPTPWSLWQQCWVLCTPPCRLLGGVGFHHSFPDMQEEREQGMSSMRLRKRLRPPRRPRPPPQGRPQRGGWDPQGGRDHRHRRGRSSPGIRPRPRSSGRDWEPQYRSFWRIWEWRRGKRAFWRRRSKKREPRQPRSKS